MTRKSFGKKSLTGVVAALVLLVTAFAYPVNVSAQSGSIGGRPANPDPQNSRTKSIFIHELSPGESAGDQLLLINNTDETKQILVYAVDSVPSSDGAFACAQAADTPQKVGKWVSFNQSEITLAPKETKKVGFKITADKAAEPGEQNGCIVMQEKKDPTFQGGIGLTFRTAIRLLVLVPGDVVKQLSAESITVSLTDDSLVVTPTVKNTGTVSLDTDVKADIFSILGTNVQSQSNTYPVLRDQPTTWNFEFDRPFWGGYYRATYTLTYDDGGSGLPGASGSNPKSVEGPSQWIFVPPHPLALLIELLILAGLAYLVWLIVRRLRQKRQVASSWHKYTVQEGDQINLLARRFGLPWRELAAANHLKAPYHLTPGQTILAPPAPEKRKAKHQ